MRPGISFNIPKKTTNASNWLPNWPNPADFRFDYYKLLQNAPNGIGSFPRGTRRSVAVVGGGAAGMAAARELYRCGLDVTIFEASGRIGGRLYTHHSPLGPNQEGYEMGAMRMPFFGDPIPAKNSILEYYLVAEPGEHHRAFLAPFPNPGQTPGEPGTGIYVNRGLGPCNNYSEPRLIRWPDGGVPEDPELAKLSKKVSDFVNRFTDLAQPRYTEDSSKWEIFWSKVVKHYDKMTFNDLVLMDIKKPMNPDTGELGGLGMTPEQAELLYTIGIGDGSWGAFYSIGALWFMRCTLFGFSSKLQTVEGLRNLSSPSTPGKEAPCDWTGQCLSVPRYEGIQSLVEYLYYVKPPGSECSLSKAARLFVNTPVRQIAKTDSGKLEVKFAIRNGPIVTQQFDFVMVTSGTWASQMSFDFVGFSEDELPQQKLTAMVTQHSISSCKLFFPLVEKYWERSDNKIPQIIITDTYIQDVYGLDWKSKPHGRGILLASYTWEDDSLKLLPFDVKTLSEKVLKKLQEITIQTTGQDITRYIIGAMPIFIQWIKEPAYHGCAKLYRAHTEANNALELAYNEVYAGRSNLYFAGENYGVEGGWTEPALRSALDAVMRLLHNEGGSFRVNQFDYNRDYPSWNMTNFPTYEFPRT